MYVSQEEEGGARQERRGRRALRLVITGEEGVVWFGLHASYSAFRISRCLGWLCMDGWMDGCDDGGTGCARMDDYAITIVILYYISPKPSRAWVLIRAGDPAYARSFPPLARWTAAWVVTPRKQRQAPTLPSGQCGREGELTEMTSETSPSCGLRPYSTVQHLAPEFWATRAAVSRLMNSVSW